MKYSQITTSPYLFMNLMMMKKLTSNEMVNKFIETANDVDDKVHARVPCDLKGLAFHLPLLYQETFSWKKHITFYWNQKIFH